MEHHNKQVEGTERLVRFQAAHYKLATEFDEFIYKGQLVQAEALKCAVEHWRRRKFNTAGAMFWQLNDCWPVSSWAVIDSALRPKAGYYFAKKFFAPVLLSFKRVENTLEVWVTNDLLNDVTDKLILNFFPFVGKKVWTKTLTVHAKSNSSSKVFEIDLFRFAKYDSARHYFHGKLLAPDDLNSEQRYFLHEQKHLQLPKAKVTSKIGEKKDGSLVISLRANAFVKNVRLEILGGDVAFDDNYFDMDTGQVKEVAFCSKQKIAQLKKQLAIRWL
jgi:beta-mannosidase